MSKKTTKPAKKRSSDAPTCTLMVRVPIALHRQFKVYCIEHTATMSDTIAAMLTTVLAK